MSDKLDIWNNPRITSRHIAALGKTGSGKTSTAKLLIEHVVREQGARVCIIDPLKSDWWGITSSRNGKEPGLPFHILGGPHKHVALHAAAGAAIGSVVASGALKHAIIDMADFDQGGPETFWAAFAKTLFHQIKGVVYLVVEEAHVFAPKEKFGFGGESQSIYWMKRIATAARTKGIRLIVCTQRTQELHNAVLGSCDTIIAHRMTAPADQKPVIDWLKANASKETTAEVTASLASLADGEAWVCAGEAQITQRHRFPMITTYDNTKTPDHDEADHKIKTAAVDLPKLMSIIGESVEQAKANDPKELKAQIAALKRELADAQKAKPAPAVKEKIVEKPILSPADLKRIDKAEASITAAAVRLVECIEAAQEKTRAIVDAATDPIKAILASVNAIQAAASPSREAVKHHFTQPKRADHVPDATKKVERPAGNQELGKGLKYKMMVALCQFPGGLTKQRMAALAGGSVTGGSFGGRLSELRTAGYIEECGGLLRATPAGVSAVGEFEELPTGQELIDYWRGRIGGGIKLEMFDALVAAYPNAMTREEIATAIGASASGGSFGGRLSELRTIGLVHGSKSITAASELFES